MFIDHSLKKRVEISNKNSFQRTNKFMVDRTITQGLRGSGERGSGASEWLHVTAKDDTLTYWKFQASMLQIKRINPFLRPQLQATDSYG